MQFNVSTYNYAYVRLLELCLCFCQVIGLTASVGVGKARDKLGAKNHILSLCANMDALYGITTVEGNKEELERHVNRPNEGQYQFSNQSSTSPMAERSEA